MPLNNKGKQLIKQITTQHGFKFHDLSDSGILHFSQTPKARLNSFKSTLRKYKLHYRLEKTQESEETGIYTMKIRTDRDHKLLKMQRNKKKINKPKSKAKAAPANKPMGLLMAGFKSSDAKDIRKELDLGNSDWVKLESVDFTKFLHMTVPTVLQYKDLLDEFQWFFDKIHEHGLSNSFDGGIKQVSQLLEVLSSRLRSDPDLEKLKQDLYVVQDEISKLHKLLLNISGVITNKVRDEAQRPVTALLEELTTYWSTLSDIWNIHKDEFMPYLDSYLKEMSKTLHLLTEEVDVVKESSINKLISIKHLLKKNVEYRMAEEIGSIIDQAKTDNLENGQVPASRSSNGSWRVYLDSCPNLSLPTRYTQVTEKSAYCRLKDQGKKCPAFKGIHGEHVLCSEAGRYKQGAYFSTISEITDKDVLEQLLTISKEDNHVLMLFKKAEVQDNTLYYARISDDRIKLLLETYPSSKRVSHYSYIVYLIAGEPVMKADNILICADKSLLVELDKGTPMAKIATVKTAAVLRLTFTSNALMDKNFIDYFRSLKAEKFSELTWDIPFKNEEDKDQILDTIKKDFSYPIQVFRVVENLDKTLSPWKHDVMAMTIVSKTKIVPSLTYSVESPKLLLSDKLYDIAAQASDSKIKVLAANLRVQDHYVIALKTEVSEVDGYYIVNHSDGTRLMTTSGRIAEVVEGNLLFTDTGEISDCSVANIPSEAVEDDNAIIIKILPEALMSLLNLFKAPAPAAIEYPNYPVFPEPSPAVNEEAPCGCSEEAAPAGQLITFSPSKEEFRPKITFLTPDLPKND